MSSAPLSEPLFFASDNGSGIHPDILAAITEANHGNTTAYGDDRYSEQAITALREAFGEAVEVYFTFGGTGANVLGIASVARSFHAVYCADCAHIWADECSAPEKFFGGKLVPIAADNGKITPAAVAAAIGDSRGVHHAVPRVVSITQATERGTLYTAAEIAALAEFAHEAGMLLHVDGARFANAAAALDVSLAALSTDAGVDILSFGGTKNGLMLGEAVIFFDPALAADAGFLRKQTTQLASKMRFIAAQFTALMTDNLWRRNAAHANAMAARLAAALAGIPGVELESPVQINALFVRLDPRYVDPLLEHSRFYLWDERRAVARWMTSFNTTPAEVDAFAALVRDTAHRFNPA